MRGPSLSAIRRIFISYRRADSQEVAGRLFDRLAPEFGRQNVFKDVDSIQQGADFTVSLKNALDKCDLVLALIGDRWTSITDTNGSQRLHKPNDFVRIELETALARNVRVIPVLIGNAEMPSPCELPESLHKLTRLHATRVRPDPDFNNDYNRLLNSILPPRPRFAIVPGKRGAIAALVGLSFCGIAGPVLLSNNPPKQRDTANASPTQRPAANDSAPEPPLSDLSEPIAPTPSPGSGDQTVNIEEPSTFVAPFSLSPESKSVIQVQFSGPEGMLVGWLIKNGYAENQLRAPSRFHFHIEGTYRLKLTNIPERDGLVLYPTLQIYATNKSTEEYLSHNTIPLGLTEIEVASIANGTLLTKVIFLPKSTMPAKGSLGVTTFTSTDMADPIEEARRRGSIIAVLRIGNLDLELPPPGDIPRKPEV